MILKGPMEERIDNILYRINLKFINKHKSPIADVEKIYKTAGIPFTDAAKRFYEKYSGIFQDLKIYEGIRGEVQIACYLYNYSGLQECEFICDLFGDAIRPFDESVDRLKKLYTENAPDNVLPNTTKIARQNPEWEAVPIGIIGHRPAIIWITKDDKLLTFRDDINTMQTFDSFKAFLMEELKRIDIRATLHVRNTIKPSEKFLSEQPVNEELFLYYMIYLFWEYDLECEGKISEIRDDRVVFEKLYWRHYCDDEGGAGYRGEAHVEFFDVKPFLEVNAKAGDCLAFSAEPFCYRRVDGQEVIVLGNPNIIDSICFISETEVGTF